MGYKFRFDIALAYVPYIMSGLGVTVLLAISSMAGGLVLGVVVAIIRVSGRRPWTSIATAYTEFFRNTPLLTQLVWLFYALPYLTGLAPTSFIAAWVGLSLNLGAFLGELIRAGITSVASGQWEAGLALGMERNQVYRRVVLPQAIRRIAPALTSYWVNLFQGTSIASLVAVPELMYRTRWAANRTWLYFELFTTLGIIYFLVTWPQARVSDWLYERFRVKD